MTQSLKGANRVVLQPRHPFRAPLSIPRPHGSWEEVRWRVNSHSIAMRSVHENAWGCRWRCGWEGESSVCVAFSQGLLSLREGGTTAFGVLTTAFAWHLGRFKRVPSLGRTVHVQALGRVHLSLGWNWAEVGCASPGLPGGPEQAPHGGVPSRESKFSLLTEAGFELPHT